MSRRAPKGLGGRGGRFWRGVVSQFDLELAEFELLAEICRSLDMADKLELEAATNPMVDTEKGRIVNPAVREVRQLRAEIRHLMSALGLEDSTGSAVPSGNELRARRAATARWAKEKGASDG